MSSHSDDTREWLEADGRGGFVSGTVSGVRTRRYHALLLTATKPPTGRVVLVNGFEAWVETAAGRSWISSQRYTGDVVHPDGARRIDLFEPEPWPRWSFLLEDGSRLTQEIVVHDAIAGLRWRIDGGARATLHVRLLMSGRDYHALHHENGAFAFVPEKATDGSLVWHPYEGVPPIHVRTNGGYGHDPTWYRSFLYTEERARGLDHAEDLASPGVLSFDLENEPAVVLLSTDVGRSAAAAPAVFAALAASAERRRRGFRSALERAADAYVVARGGGRTIVAGYPWFTDWGRDTFIALRGLCLATGRLEDARDILVEWGSVVSEGMLPNRFPDAGDVPEYNSVDASLWYVIAVHDFFAAAAGAGFRLAPAQRKRLRDAVESILEGYSNGTRYGIRADADGLLTAGEPGVQLTWMDARVGDRVVTPRMGKPVEVQALWLNALFVGGRFSKQWLAAFERGRTAFEARFWNEETGCLYDVVDCDHRGDAVDGTIRPNQIFAAGGLPVSLLEGERARRVVDVVEERLWTPLGLRSLAPGSPGYQGRYGGDVAARDGGYHQGTVWPWLLGPFVEAWVRVRGSTAEAKRQAHERFVTPLLAHLDDAGLGHVSEVADGDLPQSPGGCPFQAWSLGELLRLVRVVLAEARSSDTSLLPELHP
jgi:predicted glycogen debranching enzyme